MDFPTARIGRVAATVLALVLALGACSGEAGSGSGPAGRSAEARDTETLTTSASLGRVTGRLPGKRRQQVRRGVVEVVDRWLDAAYVEGSYPRRRFGDAWPGFTDGARREARRDDWVTSNAEVGRRVDAVAPTRRRVRVDVLAVRGRPVGATAHVDVAMRLAGDLDRTDRVRGRLFLSPSRRGWVVFGYELARATGADRKAGKKTGKKTGKQSGQQAGQQQRKGGGR